MWWDRELVVADVDINSQVCKSGDARKGALAEVDSEVCLLAVRRYYVP